MHGNNQNDKEESQHMLFMTFDEIYDRNMSTKQTFNGFAKQLCDKLLKTGCNSMIFAYGQSGSGKTFSLVGNPLDKQSENGILSLSIEYLMKSDKVSKCFISAKEIYSTNAKKIEIFDLFDRKNITAP